MSCEQQFRGLEPDYIYTETSSVKTDLNTNSCMQIFRKGEKEKVKIFKQDLESDSTISAVLTFSKLCAKDPNQFSIRNAAVSEIEYHRKIRKQ